MKKRSLLSLLALLILLALSVSAGAEELPGEIRSALEGTGMEILKTAGVDMAAPEAVSSALDTFGKLVKELEDMLN